MVTGSVKGQIPNIAGKVQTVRGPILPSELGATMMHEHIFFDTRRLRKPSTDPVGDASHADDPVTLQNLHLARDGKIPEASYMINETIATAEVTDYRNWGGGTIVDVSPIGVIRDTLALRRISFATGVHIIMGTGFYAKAFPDNMDIRTVEDLASDMIEDITIGIDSSGIRAGIVGEVGIEGNPLTSNEIKVVKAAAQASRTTGAALTFHRGGIDREKLLVLDLVMEEGAALSRTIMGHCDWIAADLPLLKEILNRGAYVEFDLLGNVGASLSWRPGQEKITPFIYGDSNLVAQAILDLVENGHEDRILLSQDVGFKLKLKHFGGTGYSFVLEKFLPHLKNGGIREEQLQKFIVDNPKRALTFVAPS